MRITKFTNFFYRILSFEIEFLPPGTYHIPGRQNERQFALFVYKKQTCSGYGQNHLCIH